jgi:hypothetical protein
MPDHASIKHGLSLIFRGIEHLSNDFPRQFTIDGRLVGDIGEVIAWLDYDLEIDKVSRAIHDAHTSDGRQVQIKATFKDKLTFRKTPDYLLGFKLFEDGCYQEVFNGPGHLIHARYRHRTGIGTSLLSFPARELRSISDGVDPVDRVPLRPGNTRRKCALHP